MKIIIIGNTKGGVGKSTVACNLAVAAAINMHMNVTLVDADPQGSAMSFRNLRPTGDIQAVSICTPTLHQDAQRLQADLVIIDAGGRDTKTFRSAIAAADLLVIPVLSGLFDVAGTEDTIESLREIRAYKDVEARFLFNQVRTTVTARDTREALGDYVDEVQPLQNSLHYHEFLKKALIAGQGVTEYRPGSPPAREIVSLLEELLKITNK